MMSPSSAGDSTGTFYYILHFFIMFCHLLNVNSGKTWKVVQVHKLPTGATLATVCTLLEQLHHIQSSKTVWIWTHSKHFSTSHLKLLFPPPPNLCTTPPLCSHLHAGILKLHKKSRRLLFNLKEPDLCQQHFYILSDACKETYIISKHSKWSCRTKTFQL